MHESYFLEYALAPLQLTATKFKDKRNQTNHVQ